MDYLNNITAQPAAGKNQDGANTNIADFVKTQGTSTFTVSENVESANSKETSRTDFEDARNSAFQPQNTEFLSIKYNKRQVPLSYEEAVTYAQKGMNYDKISNELSNIKEAYESLKKGAEIRDNEVIDESLSEGRLSAEINKFKEAVPNLSPKDIPDDALLLYKKGLPLVDAFMATEGVRRMKNEIDDLKAKLSIKNEYQENALKSAGSANGSGGATGFSLTAKAIRDMSQNEYEKQRRNIWAAGFKK